MTPEFAIALRGVFLQGLAGEFETTKKILSAVPDQNHDYKPDPKSKTAIELAWHIASVDIWFLEGIASHSFGMSDNSTMPESLKSGSDIAAWYSEQLKTSLPKVEAMTGEQLMVPVDFFGMMTMPVVSYFMFLNNHMIHHRGQLTTYLRAMGGKCPGIYGGSADEPMGA
jgi:uncharacterized damage-inducible protein DinB